MKGPGMQKPNGFTIIEVLIAILILSIGLLGVAAMQTTAIRGNTFSRDTTLGTQLAEEMIERIRVNALNAPGAYNGIDTSVACGGADPVLGDCVQWRAALQASALLSARGQVTVVTNTPVQESTTINVVVSWGTPQRSVTFSTIVETWVS
ncbi:MAG: type IV pilus modification protein PilV [Nitrospirae bacterium]|nr:type IV pilus modification protein PilV [Nitrospirota bacterium]